ncbi:MAG: hypothetical protein F2534_05620 [Actinobacteria bacterium]|nr:hypothetical protein [Actinomycetota bacterium]
MEQLAHDRGARLRYQFGAARQGRELPATAASHSDPASPPSFRSVLRDPGGVDGHP